MKISIIVPCYNEEEGVPFLVRQLKKAERLLHSYEIIFIDDGSEDNTYKLLKKFYENRKNIKILRHDKNRNLGAALRTGFKASTGDVIVPIDSDCTYPPIEIVNLLRLLDPSTDIVSASPYHPKGKVENVAGYRLFLSKAISKIYSVIMNADLYTYTAIFRAYRRKVIEDIRFRSDDFLCCAEILVYAILKGYKIKEYPTTLHARKYGRSNIRLLKVIFSHTRFIIKIIFIRLFRLKV